MVNRTGANILGFENEHEFFLRRDVCDNILRCIHPEDRTKVLEELFSIAEEGIVKNSSHRIKLQQAEERMGDGLLPALFKISRGKKSIR